VRSISKEKLDSMMVMVTKERRKSRGRILTHYTWNAWSIERGGGLFFPSSLLRKYCAHYADVDEMCTYHEKCNFSHTSFPRVYLVEDIFLDDTFHQQFLDLDGKKGIILHMQYFSSG